MTLFTYISYWFILKNNFNKMISSDINYGYKTVESEIDNYTKSAYIYSKFISMDRQVIDQVSGKTAPSSNPLTKYINPDIKVDIITIANKQGEIIFQYEKDPFTGGFTNNHEGEPIFLSRLFQEAASNYSSAGIEHCIPSVLCSVAVFIITDGNDNAPVTGYVRTGFYIDKDFSKKIKESTGTDVFFIRNDYSFAGSLTADDLQPEDAALLYRKASLAATSVNPVKIALGTIPYAIKTFDDEKYFAGLNTKLVIGRSISDLNKYQVHARIILIIIAFIAITSSAWFGLFSARRIFRPIKLLLEKVHEIKDGNLDIRIDVYTEDEIGELASAFNEMTSSVRDRNNELKRNTEELKTNQAQLIQSGKLAAIGELAAGVAHEIGNPLSAISGYAQMIQEKSGLENDIVNYASEIENEAEFIEKIIDDLLEFSRPSSNELLKVNPIELIEAALKTVSAHKAFSKINVVKEFKNSVDDIYCHPKEIQQVFLNLFMNAAQAMPEGGNLFIKARPDSLNKNIRFNIRDEGSGIDDSIKNKIFDPFFTTKPPGIGTGLGLAITYRIIEKHNGKISLEQSTRGASFLISLPVNYQNI